MPARAYGKKRCSKKGEFCLVGETAYFGHPTYQKGGISQKTPDFYNQKGMRYTANAVT